MPRFDLIKAITEGKQPKKGKRTLVFDEEKMKEFKENFNKSVKEDEKKKKGK